MATASVPPLNWHFWHNGHRVSVGLFHNKYDAAMEFRNRYGYLPDLNDVLNVLEPNHRITDYPSPYV